MSEPFLAEIRIIGFNFAPRGWAFCDGQLLPINQNQSLYALLGTTYGGDGRTSFALPDLRGRVPVHRSTARGTAYGLGARGGTKSSALTAAETPKHTHAIQASTDGTAPQDATGAVPARSRPTYGAPNHLAETAGDTTANAGDRQAHETMQPYLTLNFIIALEGLYPSRS